MYAALAQTLTFVGHSIPLFLLTFGILYLILAFVTGGKLDIAMAVLSIAGSLAWFVVTGASFSGIWMSPDVLTVIGLGIVGVILAKIFAGAVGVGD